MRDNDGLPLILATSNGTGLGHLARVAATAFALDGTAEPVLFSLSRALPLVTDLGVRGEFCQRHERRCMSDSAWQHYLADRIRALVAETGARAFAFDGAWPYAGVQLARAALPEVAFVWLRRAMWQPGVNEAALRHAQIFDAVIEPGELARDADRGATAVLDDATRVPPVTLLEQIPRLPRAEAATALGLDPDRPTALLTLRPQPPGSEGTSAADAALDALLADSDWQVALTKSPVATGELGEDSGRVHALTGVFPLARYLAAFDVAVTEAGYNSFHEVLHAAIPSVIVPTRAAVTDDQATRARWAATEGLALSAPEEDPQQVAECTTRLLDDGVRARLAERCAQLPPPTGAGATAAALREVASGFERHRYSLSERARTARLYARPVAERVARGAWPGGRAGPTDPAACGEPWYTENVTLADLTGEHLRDQPVEHLLPATSSGYRHARERIAQRYYASSQGSGSGR